MIEWEAKRGRLTTRVGGEQPQDAPLPGSMVGGSPLGRLYHVSILDTGETDVRPRQNPAYRFCVQAPVMFNG